MQGIDPIRVTASSSLPTRYGEFNIHTIRQDKLADIGEPHLALSLGLTSKTALSPNPAVSSTKMPLVRIHSECITGDVFGSVRCDCGNQLDAALESIANHGAGLLIYLRQEGRGIGIENKLRAYGLQEAGMDTVEANIELGLPVDARDYSIAVSILKHFHIERCDLLTNNPEKVSALKQQGIHIRKTIQLVKPNDHHFCHAYMNTKRQKLGHAF